MTARDGDTVRRANALALKLFGCLMISGAVVAGLLALAMTRLAHTLSDGATRYVLPGSHGRADLDPAVATALFCAAAVLLIAGLAALLLRHRGLTLANSVEDGPTRRVRRPVMIFVAGAVFLATVLGLRWHRAPQSSNEAPAWTGSR